MTQEDKEILLKDISARLPYDVIVVDKYGFVVLFTWKQLKDFEDGYISKPYLRPMSSMTEKEKNELTEMTITSPNLETAAVLFRERYYEEEPHWRNDWAICSLPKVLNWLNVHHFDYRGLIEKGLAIEVTEDNNPYK